jgi:hypothetical protein
MNKFRILVLSFAFALPLSAFAQSDTGGAPPLGAAPASAPGGGAHTEETVDAQLKTLTTQLALTISQQTVARGILDEKQKLIVEVREKFPVAKPGSPPSEDGIAAMTKVMSSMHKKMLAILTEEQKIKYDALDPIRPEPHKEQH